MRVLFFIVFLLFAFYSFTLLLPIFWGLVSSLKTPYEFWSPEFFFSKPQFGNYVQAWKSLEYNGTTFPLMLWNSIWFSVGSVVINLFFTALVSYIIAKYQFRGNKVIFNVVIVSMMIPLYGTFPATYKLYHQLGWTDSYLILLSATGVFGMSFILLTSYFRNLSWSFAESAMIDGAGHFRVFWSIMLPLAKPMLVAMFMLSFIGKWNDYMAAILYLPNKLTLAAGLFKYQEIAVQRGLLPILFAGLFIVMVPVLVLFSAFNGAMMKNMTFGGLKG